MTDRRSSSRVDRFITSRDGTKIFASASTLPLDSSKPTVVLIHGFAVSSLCWDSLYADHRWTNAVNLVSYDVRGHGRSGQALSAVGWASTHLAEDYLAVVRAFGVASHFVAGW